MNKEEIKVKIGTIKFIRNILIGIHGATFISSADFVGKKIMNSSSSGIDWKKIAAVGLLNVGISLGFSYNYRHDKQKIKRLEAQIKE